MRQYKKHIIKADDVNPVIVYLVNDKPCRVVCTAERGWKRGRVQLHEDKYGFYAMVNTFDGANIAVKLQCEDKDFYFSDINGHATLQRVPEKWVTEEAKRLQMKVEEVAAQAKVFENVALAIDFVRDLQFPKENK